MAVLVITNKLDATADIIVKKLAQRDIKVFRLNTEDVCGETDIELVIGQDKFEGIFVNPHRSVSLSDISSVYFRRPVYPELKGVDTETRAFIVGEITAYLTWMWTALADRFWVSHFSAIRKADSKISQLKVAPSLGFTIPDTLITNRPDSVMRFFDKHAGRIVNKSLARGAVQIDGQRHCVYTNPVTEEMMEQIQSVKLVPCVFQEQVDKKVELRITVVGKEVFAAEIHSQKCERTKNDWRRYDLEHTPHFTHNLPDNIKTACLALVRHYGLTFGAIDMIVRPNGEYVFLEINPNGQWAWIEDLTGLPISDAITDILIQGKV